MHFARLIVCILTAWLETSQGPMCHCVRLIPVVGLRSVLLLFLSVFLPLLFRTLPVLFPALHLQCRHRRGLKPLHSRRMRNVAPWRYIILPHPDSSLTDLLTDLATIFDRRQLHNVPLLHPARAVHEVDTGEYRILESVNYVVETCTHTGRPGELFEVRFSLRAQQLQQRFPQVIHSLLSCVFSVVLDSGTLCIASNHVRDRPYSLNTMPSPIGSSAWFFSCVLWVFLLRARARWGYSCAGSVRLSRFTSSCTVHAFVSGSPLLVCVEHAASVAFHFPFSDERQMLLRKIQWDDKTQCPVRLHHRLSNENSLKKVKIGTNTWSHPDGNSVSETSNASTFQERSIEWSLSMEEVVRKISLGFQTRTWVKFQVRILRIDMGSWCQVPRAMFIQFLELHGEMWIREHHFIWWVTSDVTPQEQENNFKSRRIHQRIRLHMEPINVGDWTCCWLVDGW